MMKANGLAPVLAGLMIGQVFAEQERPFKVVNTVRFGYSDNLYRNVNEKESFFVTDVVDLSFRAAFSDRTDLMVKSQLNLINDRGDSQVYPNLFAMLNHGVSPRLLLRFSEYFRSGEKSGIGSAPSNRDERFDYYYNSVKASADYVLTEKDRVGASVNYDMLRHDKELEALDYTQIGAGLSWTRELIPQRTSGSLNIQQRRVTYDNQPVDTPTRLHTENDAYFDATDLYVGLNHTFNTSLQGNLEAGVTRVQPNFSDAWDLNPKYAPTFFDKAENDPSLNPLFKVGLIYSPSPRTRFTGDFATSYTASDDEGYGGQQTTELTFGAQHDLTAKLTAKAIARFSNIEYDEQDANTGASSNVDEERMDLEFRLSYKLNRMHSLEAGFKHSEKEYSEGSREGWEENRVDVGWRVELN